MVKQLKSVQEFENEIKYAGLVVIDYFAEWCGPCKMIAPKIEDLSKKYTEVKFFKVDVDQSEDIVASNPVRAMPTFRFFVNGKQVDEVVGANVQAIEQKIQALKVNVDPFAGKGNKLASSVIADESAAKMNPREARLKAFENMTNKKSEPVTTDTNTSSALQGMSNRILDDDENSALSTALELSISNNNAKPAQNDIAPPNQVGIIKEQEAADYAAAEQEQLAFENQNKIVVADEWDEEMVPLPVDDNLLQQLIEMGFTDTQSRKGIHHGSNLEGAINWLSEHQDDPDLNQPYMVRKADAIPKKPLTEEEKLKRLQDIKNRVKARREQREKEEKEIAIKREKERRERGQKIDETLEERQRAQRQRENARIKKEKEDEKKERDRLRTEIARDKEIRRLNKGVLPSVLGVDGYNPSIIQYDVPGKNTATDTAPSESSTDTMLAKRTSMETNTSTTNATNPSSQAVSSKKAVASIPKTSSTTSNVDPLTKVDLAIQTIMKYRTGGDGGNALRLLLTFLKNIIDNPEGMKYRSINTESNAFKSKLAPLVGPLALLKAVGFEVDETDGKLKFTSSVADSNLSIVAKKLIEAEKEYQKLNG